MSPGMTPISLPQAWPNLAIGLIVELAIDPPDAVKGGPARGLGGASIKHS